ncbi:MAG: hypothetical protein EBT15_11845 [Betaproteobacteria bacterium]|nr:hypothetical protein [Betaproteobacteria bacterium]
MTSIDFCNIARCAELRMDLLWEAACAAKGNAWQPFHERRWREHETYMAMQARNYTLWQRGIAAINQYDRDCF